MGAPRGGGRRQRPGEEPGRGRSMERGWRGAEQPRGLSRPPGAPSLGSAPQSRVGYGPRSPSAGHCAKKQLPERARRPPPASSSLRPPLPARIRAVNSARRLEPARRRPAPGPAPAAPAPPDWPPGSSRSSPQPGGGPRGGPGGTCPAATSGAGVWGCGRGGCRLPRSPSRRPARP